jgi:hypothetical protein
VILRAARDVGLLAMAILLSVALAEAVLVGLGRYEDQVSAGLVPSAAIWQPAANNRNAYRHPDLARRIPLVYDSRGVRNHDPTDTVEKRHIWGFFGDSYTENRRIEARFSFTDILDRLLADDTVSVVNFGVDGYGLDQSMIRYRQMADLDIDRVFYVFCNNDLRNLYETGLSEKDANGDIRFKPPRPSPLMRSLGRLRLTYLAMDGYYRLRAYAGASEPVVGAAGFRDRLSRRLDGKYQRRVHDAYADSIVEDFLSDDPAPETLALAREFRALLAFWKAEVEADGRAFFLIVLPRSSDTAVAARLFDGIGFQPFFLSPDGGDVDDADRFDNDGHWNERGNLKAALRLAAHPAIAPLVSDAHVVEGIADNVGTEIAAYYRGAGSNRAAVADGEEADRRRR